jgi:hypothetical protein
VSWASRSSPWPTCGATARRSRMPSTMAQLGHRTRIRSTARDAALACAVWPEQHEPGPVRREPRSANLGQLTTAHEHASTSRRTRAARMRSQSATAWVARRPITTCTWAPGALRWALFCVPYVRVSPRDVPRVRGFTRGLAHFEACPVVSRWGILTLRTTLTRRGDHDTAQHSDKLSSPVVGNLGLFWGCPQTNPRGRVRRDGRALPGGDP